MDRFLRNSFQDIGQTFAIQVQSYDNFTDNFVSLTLAPQILSKYRGFRPKFFSSTEAPKFGSNPVSPNRLNIVRRNHFNCGVQILALDSNFFSIREKWAGFLGDLERVGVGVF